MPGNEDATSLLLERHADPYINEGPHKTSARRPSDEGAVRLVIASNRVSFLQMRTVGSHSTSGREKEGIKLHLRLVIHGAMG